MALQRILAGGLIGVGLEVAVSRPRWPYTDVMAVTPECTLKPATSATPSPAPQPPKVEPYPDIFFGEGKALGASGERRSAGSDSR
jgi:hypothetical protein